MSPVVTQDAEGTVTGNTYDKYGSTNPVVKRLMARFERTSTSCSPRPPRRRCSTWGAARAC